MGFIDKMKQANEAAQQGMNRAMQGWDDLERRMRQRWRIYPNRKSAFTARQIRGTTMGSVSGDDTVAVPINPGDILEMMARAEITPENKPELEIEAEVSEAKKPIISVHGKDVDESELDEDEEAA